MGPVVRRRKAREEKEYSEKAKRPTVKMKGIQEQVKEQEVDVVEAVGSKKDDEEETPARKKRRKRSGVGEERSGKEGFENP